jgi:hypothetical protein
MWRKAEIVAENQNFCFVPKSAIPPSSYRSWFALKQQSSTPSIFLPSIILV